MAITPSIIPAGQVTLRGYQENNIFRQAQGIESYIQLSNFNLLVANQGVVWEIPVNFEVLSIWVKTANIPTQSSKIDFLSNIVISGDNFSPTLTLNLQAQQIDSLNTWANYSPPTTIIQKGLALKAQANVPVEIIYLIGRECWLDTVNPSLIYDPN
ncbi:MULTISPECIES: hypothetical protein [unclassified Microcystis]|uniref:hypothetical protein n=1 Tax=unclassified Microcystis TaxID=2643300 RepID=UPI0011934F16|nr:MULTISPECIES: hypothetical protein [unclassified Microcystis]MCA2926996.1 hypothetical protein [Microcystis sp. M020S1]MCA2935671.1 hypothetical protein [Microcystis sp. M015S1]MCA2621226.1 hypothetical protein [Microcystis sp. M099S2]MCA2648575.1 hypothetical protein [Microcystis sp. M065S2]MCA2680778.1 hypothetical protein [Microcystis sp. M043S2]